MKVYKLYRVWTLRHIELDIYRLTELDNHNPIELVKKKKKKNYFSHETLRSIYWREILSKIYFLQETKRSIFTRDSKFGITLKISAENSNF